jgi:hypothetical protein
MAACARRKVLATSEAYFQNDLGRHEAEYPRRMQYRALLRIQPHTGQQGLHQF